MPSPQTVVPEPAQAQPAAIRALTIQPPWSDLIALENEATAKRIENRSWTRTWRGTLLIHGGLTLDQMALALPAVQAALPDDYQPVKGFVVAIADRTGIHPDDGECTPWSERGHFHWELTSVQRLQPVKARGMQGLWTTKQPLLDQIATANPWVASACS